MLEVSAHLAENDKTLLAHDLEWQADRESQRGSIILDGAGQLTWTYSTTAPSVQAFQVHELLSPSEYRGLTTPALETIAQPKFQSAASDEMRRLGPANTNHSLGQMISIGRTQDILNDLSFSDVIVLHFNPCPCARFKTPS